MAQIYRYPDDYESPACDLCGSLDSADTRKVLLSDAKGTKMNLVECLGCGLRFFSPRPKWEILKHLVADEKSQAEKLYANCSFFDVPDVEEQKRNIRSYYWKMLEDVKGVLGHVPQSYFELGGCVGWFATFAREFGVQGPFVGCDINGHAAKIANEKQGLPDFVASDFEDYVAQRQYEFVVCQDYLEHTYAPWKDLKKLADMVEPGGVMLLKTFVDELDVNREMLAPPTHAIHWTTSVLRWAIERAGLVIRDWRIDYNYMPIVIASKNI